MVAKVSPRRIVRRALVIGLAAGLLVVLFGLALHLPQARAIALGYAARAARSAGLTLEADRLDYNLLTLRVAVHGVKVSAIGASEPFFRAARVDTVVSSRIFSRVLAFDEVAIDEGVVRIVRSADGITNLPQTSGESSGDPAPIPVTRLTASRFRVEYEDAGSEVALLVPAVTFELSKSGRIALDEPADVRVGDAGTRLAQFEGSVAFDGRDLRFTGLQLATTEARLSADGTLALIRQDPAADLRVRGEGDLTRAATWWGGADSAPEGVVRFDGTLSGPLASLTADLSIASDRVRWTGLDMSGVSARTRLNAEGLAVDDARLGVGGGQVAGSGGIEWSSGQARVAASWRSIELEDLLEPLTTLDVLPSGAADGDLTARGALDNLESWTGEASVTVGDARRNPQSRVRGRAVPIPGEARLRLADGGWSLDAGHRVGGSIPVELSLSGRFRGADVMDSSLAGTVRLPASGVKDITALLARLGIDVARGDVSGSIRAEAAVSGTIGRPGLALGVESDRLEIAGQHVVNVQGRGVLRGSTFELQELVAEQPSDAETSRPPGRLRVEGRYDTARGSYEGSISAGLWRIEPTPDMPLSAVVGLEYAGTGRGVSGSGRGRAVASFIEWSGVGLGEVVTDVELADSELRFSARAARFGALADGRVALSTPYETTIRVESDTLDLARAATGARLPLSVSGAAALQVQASGPLERWREGRATIEVESLDGLIEMLPISLRGPARASYERGRIRVERFDASLGETTASVSGSLAVSDGATPGAAGEELAATLTGNLYDVAMALALVDAAQSNPNPLIASGQGPLSLRARVGGSLASPAVTADLELGPARVLVREDLPFVDGLRARAHLEGDVIDLRELSASVNGAVLTAQGSAPLTLLTGGDPPPTLDRASLRGRVSNVTAAVLEPFLDAGARERIAGSLDARFDLSATSTDLEALRGEVVIERLDLTVAQVPVRQREATRIVAEGGFARIAAWRWEGEGTALDVGGQVRLRDLESALLASGTLDARLLTPFINAPDLTTAGQVTMRVLVSGPLSSPTVNGDLRLESGEIRIRDPRVVATDLTARATLARNQVYINSLTGSVNGGALDGRGQLQYAPELQGRLALNVSGMALEFPQGLRTEVDSALELTMAPVRDGRGSPPGRLSGVVTVKRGAYREPLALVAGLLANLQRSSTATSGRASALDDLALDVRIVTDEDIVLNNNVARAQLGADLRVINVASAPALSGRAELREGGQLFLGRNRYTLESGTIDFANPTTIEPVLGIRATTRVAGEEIQVEISGPPDEVKTQLTSPSNPDLGQADLTALLLTGRRLDQLSAQEASVVGTQVLGNLAGDVLGFAGRAVGLDTLRVGGVDTTSLRDPADLASEVDPTSRLTFGASLGASFDVTLSQSLVDGGAQTWILDYTTRHRVALRLVSDDDDLRSYEFRHDLTFGAPQTIRSADVSRDVRVERVTAVRIEGEPGVAESEIREQLELGAGDRFDFIDWQDDRDRLERFYWSRRRLTARITATRRDVDAGVELTYQIEAGPETAVVVAGAQVSTGTIQAIETAWARSVFDTFLLEEAEALVRRELAGQGVYEATIEARIDQQVSQRTLRIDVTPGPRVERIEAQFAGVPEELASELRDEVGDRATVERALASPADYETAVVAALYERGYRNAMVTVGAPMVTESIVAVPVAVVAGPQFRVGKVSVEGSAALTPEQLVSTAAIEEGAVYRETDVEAARLRLQARLRAEGYASATVDVQPRTAAPDDTIEVLFLVRQGMPQVVGGIDVSGTRAVAADVVLRALRLEVGDRLRASDWLEARRRLFETGLFRRVDISVTPMESDVESAPVLLNVQVEEWPALRVRYGFQVAEERPEEEVSGRDLVPGVSGDATRRTLFGQAITLGVAARYQRRERLGRVFMSTPTLFGLPIQSSLVLEHLREEQRTNTLVTSRTSAAWEQRLRRGSLSTSYGLRFERNRTFDTDPLDADFAFDVTGHVGRLTTSVTWDTRDDPADARRGTFLSSSLEHASRRLGSDLPFVRSLSQAYHFQPWRGVVLASAARFGIVQALAGTDLLSDYRFYGGGARTLRGVVEDGLGGLDFFGSPVGGESLLLFNQEVRFPVVGWVRGVAFFDAGDVFPEAGDIGLRQLVGSMGLGLRVSTPLVLLRVDYGRTIWNRPVDDGGRWVFGIGQAF